MVKLRQVDEATTKDALEKSIKHWEQNLKFAKLGDYDKITTSDTFCELCSWFFSDYCVGCPIRNHSGKTSCKGTPYESVTLFLFDCFKYRYIEDKISCIGLHVLLIASIQLEVDFLKSLR